MATLALTAAGAALGSAALPAGVSVLGATISGATIGSQIGALAGSYVDQALFGGSGQTRTFEGPRLADLAVTASTEGAAMARLYGRARLGGQIIWATNFEEEVIKTRQDGGGGGKGGGGSRAGGATQITYRYYANFAVALCEGEISSIGRVWADGQELDLSTLTYRVHRGTQDQAVDPLIEAKMGGAFGAPAYRGTAYVVFERFALEAFGNRVPQLAFEVHRGVDRFHELVRAVVIIPGSGEFVYGPDEVAHAVGGGAYEAQNVHTLGAGTDWTVALDQLEEALPRAKTASLTVSWFGDDLRAGQCRLRPGVELDAKATQPLTWGVAGLARGQARLVSRTADGRAAYGGTPSDQTVVAAIKDMAARGIAVTFMPFILMDVPADNVLPDPYGAASQAAYPWRGRITLSTAPGLAGSVDQTAAAANEVAAFVGVAQVSDFSIVGETVLYAGPQEWSLRRMVLHYAHLCKAAGGVDAFALGSELRGLSQVRAGPGAYPFVTALMQLADDVRAVLGAQTKITYAADWSEYFGHQPADGSGDVYFHLDPLWASPSIDAVGIDVYWPLADWRDGRAHADWLEGWRSPYDLDYLSSRLRAGEGHDWYYASPEDRVAQTRTPITDGAGAAPWMFRFKDIKGWWENAHRNRPGGVEAATTTAWVPQSKPIWFMEVGCPAVDKGANQPNVFVDPKSAESRTPYFSDGTRDDLMQRRYLQAIHQGFDPAHSAIGDAANPLSSVYGGRMVDLDRMYVYAWDARPYPAFPTNAVWGDGDNWRLGHWLNGRVAAVPLSDCVGQVLDDYGFEAHQAGALNGTVPGFVIDRVMSAREAIQPLELAHFFDAIESGAQIRFQHRSLSDPFATLRPDELVEEQPEAALVSQVRAQETALPASAKVNYVRAGSDYEPAVAEARRLVGASGRVALADLPLVMEPEQAQSLAESWLFESWSARERATFTLSPRWLAVEPGDAFWLEVQEQRRLMRVLEVSDEGPRRIEAVSLDQDVYGATLAPQRQGRVPGARVSAPVEGVFLDLPLLGVSGESPHAGWVAAYRTPWPGTAAFLRSPEETGFALQGLVEAPAVMGMTATALAAGPTSRWDRANTFEVDVFGGTLESLSALQVLDGANALALESAPGVWEVLQFSTAALIAPRRYRLGGLLRGQHGSEGEMAPEVAPGARVVLLDEAVAQVQMAVDEIGLAFTWRYGPGDRAIGDASYRQAQHAFTGLGLRPLSPVHVRVSQSGGGDLDVRWVRRTRVGGDRWDQVDVPLGESEERYAVELRDATGALLRTLDVAEPQAVYPRDAQIADHGAVLLSGTVRVFQVAPSYGRGAPGEAAFAL
ncbi:MAG: glycoside hydrolase/phage tail family protein [Pseudomonadota bacterium]